MADGSVWKALGAGVVIGIVLVAAAYLLGSQGPTGPRAPGASSAPAGMAGGATATSPRSPARGATGATAPSNRVVVLEAQGGLLRFKSWSDIEALIKAYGTSPVGVVAYRIAGQTPTVTATAIEATTVTATGAGAAASSPHYIGTNIQVPGVDEQDIVKTNGREIFVASHGIVKVYKAYPPSSLALEGSVDVCDYIYRHTEIFDVALVAPNGSIVAVIGKTKPAYCEVRGLYALPDGGFIALADELVDYGAALPGGPRTWVLKAYPNGTVAWSYWASGRPLDSRLLVDKGLLIVVSTLYATSGQRPATSQGPLPASSVYLAGNPATSYTMVTVVDVGRGKASTAALLGPITESIYVDSAGNLYLALGNPVYRILLGGSVATVTSSRGALAITVKVVGGSSSLWKAVIAPGGVTRIVKVSTANYTVEPEGYVDVGGRLYSQWFMNAAGGYLYIVTEGNGGNVSLYVVDTSNMTIASKLEGVAVREWVRAVRLVGDMLYLVTTRRVDPLFAINVSDPLHPRVVGYLKAPGFDAYLHPVNSTLLLGVGYENSSLRVSLYRISRNGTPVVLDRLYLGHAMSPVLSARGGSRAFLYIPQRGLALIPYTVIKAAKGESGVFLVALNGSKLVLAGKLVHMESRVYPLLIRAVVIGDYAYTIIPVPPRGVPTVKAWSLDTLELVASAP